MPFEHADLDQREEPDNQTVQALSTGQQLKHHDLTGFGGILTQKTGTGFTGNTGALSGANTGKTNCKAGAQKSKCQIRQNYPRNS